MVYIIDRIFISGIPLMAPSIHYLMLSLWICI